MRPHVSDMTVPSCSTNKYGELSWKLTFIVISKCFVTKNVCGTDMFMLLLKSWLHYPLKFIFIAVRVYLVGYIFCIIDYHICRDIFDRLYILYNRLPYMSGYI
jgi:hypothetical protein